MAVFSALASHNTEAASSWDEQYPEPQDQSIPAQIHAANQYWRRVIGQLPFSTISVRENLMDRIELSDWVRLFATEVAPVVAAFAYPPSHGRAA